MSGDSDGQRSLGVVTFGIHWDAPATGDASLDLDLAAFVLDASGKVLSDNHFVFFNNDAAPGGAVVQTTSAGSDDASEMLSINTSGLERDVKEVVIAVTVYEEAARFGRLANARVTAQDSRCGELADFDLSVGLPNETAVVFAKLVDDGGVWRFHAVGEKYDGLLAMAQDFGVNVG